VIKHGDALQLALDLRASGVDVRTAAQDWYDREMANAQRALGPAWPALRACIDEVVKDELADRLISFGWRPIEPPR
jgi:hypothetical protein